MVTHDSYDVVASLIVLSLLPVSLMLAYLGEKFDPSIGDGAYYFALKAAYARLKVALKSPVTADEKWAAEIEYQAGL